MDIIIKTFAGGISGFINIFMVACTLRIYMTYFPNINLYTQPFNTIRQLTDPYLNFFSKTLPPTPFLDISPIIAFMVLQAAKECFNRFAITGTIFVPGTFAALSNVLLQFFMLINDGLDRLLDLF